MSPDGEHDDTEKRLVCGVCEELLPGTYTDEAAAEQAIDEHERSEHPDEDDVVVVHVSSDLVELEGPEGVVDIAKGAQERLDSGDVGEGMGLG